MGKGKGHIPIRTCISCGTKGIKSDFIRLSLTKEGRLIRDDSGRGFGRGAYVCGEKTCWEKSRNPKRLGRIFKTDKAIILGPDLKNS
jgi:predicted RNA-binding protein YlxR (DUF448 family)